MNGEVSRGVTHPPVVYATLLGSLRSRAVSDAWVTDVAQAADCSSATKVTAVCNQACQLAARPMEINEITGVINECSCTVSSSSKHFTTIFDSRKRSRNFFSS